MRAPSLWPPGLPGSSTAREGKQGCWARPAAHLGVDVCVLLQAHRVAEGFAADLTGEGPGPAVGASDMHLEPVWGGEDLEAGQRVRSGGCGEGPGLGPRAVPPSAGTALQP